MRILFLTLLLILSAIGCSNEGKICLILDEQQLVAPLEASKFTGFLAKKHLKLYTDVVHDRESLIKFLNLSRYNAFIADSQTVNFITANSRDWVSLCSIAIRKGGKEVNYVLAVNKRLLCSKEVLIGLIESWNYGVDLLKDPVVQEIIFSKLKSKADTKLKFTYCKG